MRNRFAWRGLARSVSNGGLALEVGERAEELALGARLARDLPRMLRRPIGPREVQARVRERVQIRDQRLISLVERYIYANPRSPYRALLRHAGCEPGDFRALVGREGAEGALTTLADRGVFVRIDELKGRRELVRGSLRLSPRPRDFDHPSLRTHLLLYTGGSGRRPSRVAYSLGFLAEWAHSVSVLGQAHGLDRPAQAFWWPLPLAHTIMAGLLGQPIAGWFYPVHPLPPRARWAARYLALLGRLGGRRFPGPRRCDPEQAAWLAGWLAEQVRLRQQLLVWATPSACARLGLASVQSGVSLQGVAFLATGEPITAARRQQAEAAGAQVMPCYSSVDVSAPAYGCARPASEDDMHVMADRCAIIARPRQVDQAGISVNALLATALTPDSPKIAFNTETGDYGQLVERSCGCLLERLGLPVHLSAIRSFEKLTGEGVTFVRADLQRILEEVLPQRFGGSSLDYQLAEERGPDQATQLVLRVSPAAGPIEPAALRTAFLAALRAGGLGDDYNARVWERFGTVVVRREAPRLTAAGKVLPLDLARDSAIAARRDG